MTNSQINAGIRKLDEYVNKHTIKEYPHCIVSTDILLAILEAMKTAEPSELDKILDGIDERFEGRLSAVEERLSRLEELISTNVNKSQPSECDCKYVAHIHAFVQPNGKVFHSVCGKDCTSVFKHSNSEPRPTIEIDRKIAEEWLESRKMQSGIAYAGSIIKLEDELRRALKEGK